MAASVNSSENTVVRYLAFFYGVLNELKNKFYKNFKEKNLPNGHRRSIDKYSRGFSRRRLR